MIERVARSIWEDQRARIQNQDGLNARLTWRSKGAPEKFWDSYENDARAAIDVMREPTDAMVASMRRSILMNTWGDAALRQHCRDLIDAALAAPERGGDK